MRISLVEYAVLNCPKGMENWRMYRVEYGGHAESCNVEGTIWLPEDVSPDRFERLMDRLQKK